MSDFKIFQYMSKKTKIYINLEYEVTPQLNNNNNLEYDMKLNYTRD